MDLVNNKIFFADEFTQLLQYGTVYTGVLHVIDGATNNALVMGNIGANASAIGVRVDSVSNYLFVGPGTGIGVIDEMTALLAFGVPSPVSESFTFAAPTGTAYSIAVTAQPLGQTCSVTNGAGTMGMSPVQNVTVNCADNYVPITGSISGLTTPGSVSVSSNGVAIDSFAFNAVTAFVFATAFPSGAAYSITATGNGQTSCSVPSGNGIASPPVVQVSVTCN